MSGTKYFLHINRAYGPNFSDKTVQALKSDEEINQSLIMKAAKDQSGSYDGLETLATLKTIKKIILIIENE